MPFISLIFGLFTGPFGKIFSYGTIILAVVAGAYGYLKYEEHEAVVQAEAQWNAAQKAQVAKDNAANAAALQEALTQEEALTKQVADLNAQLANKSSATNAFIAKQKATTVDPIFNQTLKMLRGY